MSGRRTLALILLGGLVSAALVVRARLEEPKSNSSGPKKSEVPSINESVAQSAAAPSPSQIQSPAPNKTISNVTLGSPQGTSTLQPLPAVPSVDQLRDEVSRDPHSTPTSMIDFAGAVGDRLDEVRKNSNLAEPLLQELTDCAKAEEKPASIRAFCIQSAARLNEISGGKFRSEIETLKDRASAEVKKIVQTND